MKSIQKLLSIILVIIISSCGKDEIINPSDNLDLDSDSSQIITRSNQNNLPYNVPIYSDSELIVQYNPGTDPLTKSLLRAHHGVVNYEVCQLCFDESIELWFFGGPIAIEPKKQAIEDMGGLADVDYEFDFVSELGETVVGSEEDLTYLSLIAPTNSGVTVAVLDTGFDPFFPFWYDDEVPLPILYNASETGSGEEYSGWDFVNGEHNAFDDNPGKHGTIVAFEINSILSDAGIPHQILPIKVCNAEGETSYFQFLCASKYVFEIADVVQMSLGWFDDGFGDFENTIFNNLLDEYNNVLVVTSAGNGNGDEDIEGDDNDDDPHYPSGYPKDNVIAVAATNAMSTDSAYFSNYGDVSVDFWAAGQNVPFYDYGYVPIPGGVQGTSFAAPQIAALAAKHLHLGGGTLTPADIVELLNINGLPVPGEYDDLVKYDKYYPMLVD